MTARPRRRWFRFRLRTLFVLVTALAIPLGWLSWNVKRIADRKAAKATIEANGGIVVLYRTEEEWVTEIAASGGLWFAPPTEFEPDPRALSAISKWLGDFPVNAVYVQRQSDLELARRVFPESDRITEKAPWEFY